MPEQTRAEAVASIDRSARHLHMLIRSFADARRLETDALDLHREPVCAASLASDLVHDLRAMTGRDISFDGEECAGCIHADPVRVRQILTNLVVNAVRYSPPPLPITVQVRVTQAEVHVSVRDRGTGISAEQQALVFEKFRRLDTRVEGTGIGLYVSRGLARAHGGDIELESAPGAGSTFTLRLPRDKPARSGGARVL